MITGRTATRAAPSLLKTRHYHFAFRPATPYAARRQSHFLRSLALVTAVVSAATTYQWLNGDFKLIQDVHADAPAASSDQPSLAEIVFEKAIKPKNATKAQTRDQISSQHLQVRKSWENPGVWSWGANDGKVVAPDATQTLIRNPKWSSYFNGKLLRDMKISRTFGAAISENGDLIQWGSDFSKENKDPVVTLKGKNLKSIVLSKDRVLALSGNGEVFSLSASQEEQLTGPKVTESSWIPGFSSISSVSYRNITPKELGVREKITQLAGGLEHALLLTSSGRVFASASGSSDYPAKGQMGIPGLTWFTRPKGAYDAPLEIQALHGFKIAQVAAGDYHSVALDRQGRVFTWGDNQRGQLGIGETSQETTIFESPTMVPVTKMYAGTSQTPVVTKVFAGGNTTFFTVDATRIASAQDADDPRSRALIGRVSSDVWACGHGIWGQLGNGRWTHVQALPTKIAPFSGLFEYDEKARKSVPIRMRDISVGANHVAATMDNVTYVEATDATNENDTNWGADVLFFGNNEFFQLGTGKRNNVVTPTYINSLDRSSEVKEGKRAKGEVHRFHATPMAQVKHDGRWVKFEQRVVCGRGVTAVYSGV